MRAGIKDKEKVRRTVERIKEWPFEKVIVTHGHNILAGGRERFIEATRDL